MGLEDATPIAISYWLYALEFKPNTIFKQKDKCKTTWMHPRSKHWHMIDFIITRCRDKMDIHSTRAMRGANCWTDHQMLRSKVAFRIRQKHNRQGTGKPTKLNIAKLNTISHRQSFEQEMDSALAQWEDKESSTPDEERAALQQVVYNTAKTYLGLVQPQQPGAPDSYEQKRPSPPESVANQEH
ncbi:hypothetical protein NP493_798g01020 [Ridgeia piscesae]|uniref:Uncharacterized protein n=1 Tax=Ridgeia piscesae TaxID=27915 RepID=A0AAD9KNC9_RIDPI|nr:hypothetical protein NP493_798g01020 [Ridgeia piscesae]